MTVQTPVVANRPNRKASDQDIIRLNSVGLSLSTIAKTLDIHPTTVTLRLKGLKIEPADTRRAFMEDVVTSMPAAAVEWLADQLGPHLSIKDYIRNTLVEKFVAAKERNATA
jgi:hypothetical protein